MSDYHYCSECKYRVLEDDNDESHKNKFGCDNLIETEIDYHRFESEYWLREILELLDVAEDLISIDSEESKPEVYNPFGMNYSSEDFLFERKPRIAYILIDNAIEKILFSKIYMTNLVDKLDKITFKKAKDSFPIKLNLIMSEKLISKDDKNLLLVYHQIRNKLYHNLIPEDILFLKLANTYLVFSRDILIKLFDIIYPLKSKKENLLKFNESEIIDLFLDILEKNLNELKKNLREEEDTIFPYIQGIRNKIYTDFQEYIMNLIKDIIIIRENPSFNPVFDEISSSISPNYSMIKDLLESVNIVKKMSEQNIDRIREKIAEIIKRIVRIFDINQILYFDISGFYEYMEMEEDRLREMQRF